MDRWAAARIVSAVVLPAGISRRLYTLGRVCNVWIGDRSGGSMRSEVVCRGVRFGEGPVWCDDGTLVVTSVADGALVRVDVESGATTRIRRHRWRRERRRARGRRIDARDAERRHRLLAARAVRGTAGVPTRDAGPAARAHRRHGRLPGRRRLPRAQRPRGARGRSRVLHRSPAPPAAAGTGRTRDGARARRHDQHVRRGLPLLQRHRVHARRCRRRGGRPRVCRRCTPTAPASG